jgi:hypothetical protein
MTSIVGALWLAGFLGQAALFIVLVVRKRFRDYPVFTGYITFELLTTIVLYSIHRFGTHHLYFVGFWTLVGLDYCLQVGVLAEIAIELLRPNGQWLPGVRRYFLMWGSVGLVGAALLASFIGPPQGREITTGSNRLWNVRADIFSSLVISGFFIAISTLANRLGIRRRSYTFALGIGLTLLAFSGLLEEFSFIQTGWNHLTIFTHVRMCVYIGSVAYWSWAFWRPDSYQTPVPPEQLVALHERVQCDLDRLDGGSR